MLQLTPTIVMSQVSKNSCKNDVTALLHTDVLCSTISRSHINPVQHCTHPFPQLFQGTVVDKHSCLLGLEEIGYHSNCWHVQNSRGHMLPELWTGYTAEHDSMYMLTLYTRHNTLHRTQTRDIEHLTAYA